MMDKAIAAISNETIFILIVGLFGFMTIMRAFILRWSSAALIAENNDGQLSDEQDNALTHP